MAQSSKKLKNLDLASMGAVLEYFDFQVYAQCLIGGAVALVLAVWVRALPLHLGVVEQPVSHKLASQPTAR